MYGSRRMDMVTEQLCDYFRIILRIFFEPECRRVIK